MHLCKGLLVKVPTDTIKTLLSFLLTLVPPSSLGTFKSSNDSQVCVKRLNPKQKTPTYSCENDPTQGLSTRAQKQPKERL